MTSVPIYYEVKKKKQKKYKKKRFVKRRKTFDPVLNLNQYLNNVIKYFDTLKWKSKYFIKANKYKKYDRFTKETRTYYDYTIHNKWEYQLYINQLLSKNNYTLSNFYKERKKKKKLYSHVIQNSLFNIKKNINYFNIQRKIFIHRDVKTNKNYGFLRYINFLKKKKYNDHFLKKLFLLKNYIYLKSFSITDKKSTFMFKINNSPEDINNISYLTEKEVFNGFYKHYFLRTKRYKRFNHSVYLSRARYYYAKRKSRFWLYYKKFYLMRTWRRYPKFFYILDDIKKYNDCFYVVNNFIYWYNLNNFTYKSNYFDYIYRKRNKIKLDNIFFRKFKYYRYLNWFNTNFNFNYKNIELILKSYYNMNSRKNNNLSNWIDFMYRQKKMFRYNFFYRIYRKKKSYYNYFYSKKLYLINTLKLTNKPKYSFTSYINDTSLLFYDKIANLNYTEHIDEKYFFYIKNLLFNKIYNNIKSKFNSLDLINYKKDTIFNSVLVFKNKYTIKYKKLYSFLSFKKESIINKSESYFYSLSVIKYYIFILKNNLFSFFKEFIVHKYKVAIYSGKFKNNIVEKQDNWVNLFYYNLKKGSYCGKSDFSMKNKLHTLAYSECLLNLNYLDWFIFTTKLIKNIKKTFFQSYNNSYKYLYKKQIPFFKKKYYINYMIEEYLEKKKYYFSKLSKVLRRKNSYFNKKLNKETHNKLKRLYKRFIKYKFKKWKLSSFKRRTFFSKKLTVKKKRKKNFDKKTYKYIFSYCKNTLLKSNTLNDKNSNLFFQNSNNPNSFIKENEKELFPFKFNKDFFLNLWSNYVTNKKITIRNKLDIVNCLYVLRKKRKKRKKVPKWKFIRTQRRIFNSSLKKIVMYYYLFNYFSFRNKYFNVFFNLKKNNKISLLFNKKIRNKNVNRTNLIKVRKSYRHLWYDSWLYYFTLTNYSNIFIYFFLHLKKLILYMYINNSFSIYRNRILIHNFKNNILFLRNSFFQSDYVIKNFLNLEIDEVMKKF